MSLPSPSSPGDSLLARYLGSEAAAQQWRERARRREEEALRRAIALDYRAFSPRGQTEPNAKEMANLRAEIDGLRRAVQALSQRQRDLEAELAEAANYLANDPMRGIRNGTPATR